MQAASDWHALAMAIFAFEELAKYSELKLAKQSATGDEVEINDRLFKDHKYKQDIARRLLPPDVVDLFPAGYGRQRYGESWYDMESTMVSPDLRLDAVFVNWKDGQWVVGAPFLPERLKNFVDEIINALNKLETESIKS
jgi:AbiV family abortive infection protein